MPIIFSPSAYAVMRLKRTCPKCGKEQVVSKEYAEQIVLCNACGAALPPPPLEQP